MRAQGVDKGEEDENHSSNEDLEEVPLDDLDVSDSDEGSGGYDSGEENDPTFADEFDDGYYDELEIWDMGALSSTPSIPKCLLSLTFTSTLITHLIQEN
jgi:hypothetical protein